MGLAMRLYQGEHLRNNFLACGIHLVREEVVLKISLPLGGWYRVPGRMTWKSR